MQVVQDFNKDPKVHGILVQLPLPKHIVDERILDAISIEKDIDGFHPANIGSLAMRGRTPLFAPCTPKVMLRLCCRQALIALLSCAVHTLFRLQLAHVRSGFSL